MQSADRLAKDDIIKSHSETGFSGMGSPGFTWIKGH